MKQIFHALPSNSSSSSSNDSMVKPPPWARATVKFLRDVEIAFRAGLAAHREYERLISEGVGHDPALRTSLGARTGFRPTDVPQNHRNSCRLREVEVDGPMIDQAA